jgi:hypothetical protein
MVVDKQRSVGPLKMPSRIVSELVRVGHLRWTWAVPNKKDAIVERFRLDRLKFEPFFEDHDDHFSIVVPDRSVPDRPGENERSRALGFIKYEKKTGRVTMANSCTQFPIECLGMGFTTKDCHDHLAGCHGEGLKLELEV